MTDRQFAALKEPFPANAIQWRITATSNGKGLAVPYLDSRAIQNRLDGVIGREKWQNSFETNALMKDNSFICTISIYNDDLKEWISKSNGAGSTDIEPVKGGLSDAFKRAASMWNIGRYLYDFEGVWVNIDERKRIANTEKSRLDKIYIDTVNRLFPQAKAAPIQRNAPSLVNAQIYTVINAAPNKDHTIIELWDGAKAYKAYYKGVAQLAKNQRITGAALIEKESAGTRYYILESFRIADYSQSDAA